LASDNDHTLLTADDVVTSYAKANSGAESDTTLASSSSNATTRNIVKKDVPMLQDYKKKSMVTEVDLAAYYTTGQLLGGVISSSSDLGFLTIDNTTIICFESHLIARLGLPPSMFLLSILNFLRCELVHLNPNAITALSCFIMMCECWLRIDPDTTLFWYFYGPAQYDKHVISGIGLSLRHHHLPEYLDATFNGCWKGAFQKWFLNNTHTEPQWRINIFFCHILMISERSLNCHHA
jgi:hypothetical protein